VRLDRAEADVEEVFNLRQQRPHCFFFLYFLFLLTLEEVLIRDISTALNFFSFYSFFSFSHSFLLFKHVGSCPLPFSSSNSQRLGATCMSYLHPEILHGMQVAPSG
jgi:hypothetical protein